MSSFSSESLVSTWRSPLIVSLRPRESLLGFSMGRLDRRHSTGLGLPQGALGSSPCSISVKRRAVTFVHPWVLYREPGPCIPALRKERDCTHSLVCTACARELSSVLEQRKFRARLGRPVTMSEREAVQMAGDQRTSMSPLRVRKVFLFLKYH